MVFLGTIVVVGAVYLNFFQNKNIGSLMSADKSADNAAETATTTEAAPSGPRSRIETYDQNGKLVSVAKPVVKTVVVTKAEEEPAPDSRLNGAQFDKLIGKAKETMPKNDDVRGLPPDDTHQLPKIMLTKMKGFNNVIKAEEANPQFRAIALNFYLECAKQDDVVPAARGRCLTHARKTSQALGKPIDEGSFPEEIKQLADFLPF